MPQPPAPPIDIHVPPVPERLERRSLSDTQREVEVLYRVVAELAKALRDLQASHRLVTEEAVVAAEDDSEAEDAEWLALAVAMGVVGF